MNATGSDIQGTLEDYSDAAGERAFQHFESLLRKVQVGSSLRASGSDLRLAKKAYADYLPVLQPIGQKMLSRAIGALDEIRSALRLPAGYSISDATDYRNSRFGTFVAGEFQLNDNGSLYIKRDVDPRGAGAFDAEIRVFTRKVYAFAPIWVGEGTPSGRRIGIFDESPWLKADSYEALVEKLVTALQDKLDGIAPIEPGLGPDADDDDQEMGMKP